MFASTGTPRKRGSNGESESKLDPMNNAATITASVMRVKIRDNLRKGMSEPISSMFIFSCPRVSILSASPE